MLWNCSLNMPTNLENSAVATELEKVCFHSNPKKGDAKECLNYHTISLISHASKVMLKILQTRLWQYINLGLCDVQAGFRKGRVTRSNCQHLLEHQKSKRVPESTSASLAMMKPLTVWITTNCKEMGIPDHLTWLLRNLYASQETTVITGHETRLVPNWERSTSRLYIVTLLI